METSINYLLFFYSDILSAFNFSSKIAYWELLKYSWIM